jgi:hypothetical protein
MREAGMSQPRSSIDPAPTVTEEEMNGYLEQYCAQDAPLTPLRRLLEWLRDPFESEQEREAGDEVQEEPYRPHPLLLSLACFVLVAIANFLYFTFRSQ